MENENYSYLQDGRKKYMELMELQTMLRIARTGRWKSKGEKG